MKTVFTAIIFFYVLDLIMTKLRQKQHVISILPFADNTGKGLSYIVLTVKRKKLCLKNNISN